MEAREQWGTRAGFIMAAIGSAIGLGNIWRFPAVAYDGGAEPFLYHTLSHFLQRVFRY